MVDEKNLTKSRTLNEIQVMKNHESTSFMEALAGLKGCKTRRVTDLLIHTIISTYTSKKYLHYLEKPILQKNGSKTTYKTTYIQYTNFYVGSVESALPLRLFISLVQILEALFQFLSGFLIGRDGDWNFFGRGWLNGCQPKNRGGPQKWMVYFMENPIKMDDLGVPLFLETPK